MVKFITKLIMQLGGDKKDNNSLTLYLVQFDYVAS